MFNNYFEVRDWLEGHIPLVYGKEELGLERIKNLLRLLGNPQEKFKSIHIAGTSGKGSTAFYCARLLEEKGFKVGLHISPHLVDIRERMQILESQKTFLCQDYEGQAKVKSQRYGSLMPIRQFVALFNEIAAVVEDIKRKQPQLAPSYFEILVAASFKYFADEKVDWAVVEVGLGGKLDATNVLVPEVSVITNIGLDHMEILGETIEKIAKEKAGIIKKGVPVVTGAGEQAFKVIADVARERQAPLIKIDTQYAPERSLVRFFPTGSFLALAAVEAVKIDVGTKEALKAFEARFAGRLEKIAPGVILDGAHNADKIRYLINFVGKMKSSKVVLVVGFKEGKDWRAMLNLLLSGSRINVSSITATKYKAVTDTGKGSSVDPKEIAEYLADKYQVMCKIENNSQKAVFDALQLGSGKIKDELILITGSLYLVGEVRTLWHLPDF